MATQKTPDSAGKKTNTKCMHSCWAQWPRKSPCDSRPFCYIYTCPLPRTLATVCHCSLQVVPTPREPPATARCDPVARVRSLTIRSMQSTSLLRSSLSLQEHNYPQEVTQSPTTNTAFLSIVVSSSFSAKRTYSPQPRIAKRLAQTHKPVKPIVGRDEGGPRITTVPPPCQISLAQLRRRFRSRKRVFQKTIRPKPGFPSPPRKKSALPRPSSEDT